MEWTTQSQEHAQAADGGDPYASPAPPPPQAEPPTQPIETQAPVAAPQAPPGLDHCPSCGAWVHTDQRYCLECGQRRGEPRLPFMDAVVFMEAMQQPKEGAQKEKPKSKRRGISPNAALIAGVGTLLLALGIGVLIGRSGEHSTASAPPPQVVTVEGGGATAAGTGSGPTTAERPKAAEKSAKHAKTASHENAATAPSASVLKPKAGVKLPPPTASVGEKCDKGTAGCDKSGKFTGDFFGE